MPTHTLIDPKIPVLEPALDPQQAQIQFQNHCTLGSELRVTSTTLIRHKPGRRALIAYDVNTPNGPLTLLGKIRAKGTDYNSYRVQQTLWDQGFAADSPDGYAVPEPMGVISDWNMWLQHCVLGVPATQVLPTATGVDLAHRIAALIHKLHRTPVPTIKTHTLIDELAILHQRLPLVAQDHPQWHSRITHLLSACDVVCDSASKVLNPATLMPTGIHRDFYGDQILVDGDRLWLVDLDLYCQGHPALDIGNFIAHITEQSLRQMGDPEAMADREIALQTAFVHACPKTVLSAQDWHRAIALYTTLTLVRHVHISTRIPARRPFTEALLTLAEDRLKLAMPTCL